MADNIVIDYAEFFQLPTPPPALNKDCIAKCKLCGHECKYAINSKGNLNHHLKSSHPDKLKNYRESKSSNQNQIQLIPSNQSGTDNLTIGLRPFIRQDSIAKSLVKNLISKGGLPVSIVETNWFRAFIKDAVPMFNIPTSRTVWEMLEKMERIYQTK